ncbi:hypothetical protein [Bacteroides helcogenes]|uniref:hypothetical protein n=1 Tax=Bacteroides helcogenes TaxID=290053 RepID=UPI00059FEEF0|nr:hypothetical protein [Bacteroides helcogenes]MDY5239490.1 hypothetical protein [Bacteroides helcogenes]
MKKSDFRTGLAAVLLLACCFLASPGVRAQTVIRKSDKTRPAWLTDKTPKTTNSTFHYQLAEAESETLEGARQECLTVLSRYIGQSWKISGEAETDIRTEDRNGQINTASVYNFHYKIKDEEINVTSTKYDEYWEYIYYTIPVAADTIATYCSGWLIRPSRSSTVCVSRVNMVRGA